MDKFGRKKLLMAGGLGMCVCHIIVAAIIGKYQGNFGNHKNAGWAGVAFIYVGVHDRQINIAKSLKRTRFLLPILPTPGARLDGYYPLRSSQPPSGLRRCLLLHPL